MNSLLITGATGYIGGKLADYYVQRGMHVRLLVRSPKKLDPELCNSCQVFEGDITTPGTIASAAIGADAVLNAAGLLGHWGLKYQQLYDVNVKGTLNLIRAAFDKGVSRVVHLSAGGVTGPVGDEPADETYQPQPVTAYERTKWEGEKSALKLAGDEDLNLLILRPTFTYGPSDPHKLALFKAIYMGRFAYIGDGLSTVHPIYIDDLITGIDLGLRSTQKQKSIILGGPQPVTKNELIAGIANALGVKEPKLRLPVSIARILAFKCELLAGVLKFAPPITKSRILALSRNWGYSIERAQKELNYVPVVDLNEGLKRTVSWYREHGWL